MAEFRTVHINEKRGIHGISLLEQRSQTRATTKGYFGKLISDFLSTTMLRFFHLFRRGYRRAIIPGLAIFIFIILGIVYYQLNGFSQITEQEFSLNSGSGTNHNASQLKTSLNETQSFKLYEDGKGNDIILSLVRNEELNNMLQSIAEFEERFNANYHYDWWFLNNVPFTTEFMESVEEVVSGRTKFILIPEDYWSYPDHIDQERAAKVRAEMDGHVPYGSSESYRFMCRFNSGFFYKLKELENIDYYWRVEPGINYKCDIKYDVFQHMRMENKLYGFTMALGENAKTIPTLWEHTRNFFDEHSDFRADNNNIEFLTDDMEETYNGCHFWSNFEIAHLDIFRDSKYEAYFQYLESAGGFFYERWGDAPVHSIAFSIMLETDRFYFVSNTGYRHYPNQDCPTDQTLREELNCECTPAKDFTWHKWSCVNKFFDVHQEIPKPNTFASVSEYYPFVLGQN